MGKKSKKPSKDLQHLNKHNKYFEELARTQDRNEKYIDAIHCASYDERFPRMYKVLPERKFGKAEIRHFDVTPEQSMMTRLRAQFNPDTRWHGYVAPGRYARLTIDDELFMTDTGFERWSSFPLLEYAHGNVLISGLGLGMVILPLLLDSFVQKIFIVEKEPDVVGLVAAPLSNFLLRKLGTERRRCVEVYCGDIWTWDNPDKLMFDTIFHDIWPSFGPDLLPEFKKLKRRYKKWLNKGGWQGCWAEDVCKQLARENEKKRLEFLTSKTQ